MSGVGVNGAAAGAWAKAGTAAQSATSPATADSFEILPNISCTPSKSVVVRFAGAYPHGLFDIDDEDLAVADRAGFRGMLDRFDDAVRVIGGDDDLEPDLGHEVRLVLRAAIDF